MGPGRARCKAARMVNGRFGQRESGGCRGFDHRPPCAARPPSISVAPCHGIEKRTVVPTSNSLSIENLPP